MNKRTVFSSGMTRLSILVLSACSTDPASSMYEHLEEQAKQEQKAADVAEQRARKDEISVNTYQAVLEAGADEFKRAQNERDELTALNKERTDLLKQEQTIRTRAFEELDLQQLKEEFTALSPAVKKDGTQLLDVYEQRKKAFNTFLTRYTATMVSEKKVLSYLTEKPNFVKIDEATADLNRTSRQATNALKTFNQLTVRYNELKPAFYEKAGLNIK